MGPDGDFVLCWWEATQPRVAVEKGGGRMATGAEHWSVRGRTVLVTGGTGGIGYHTARVLAGWGAQVLITGRDAAAGRRAAAAIRQQAGQELVSFLPADHATVQGNRQMAHDIRAAITGLDVLINNVGGLYPTRRETSDGYEATLAMNFVGPFTLTLDQSDPRPRPARRGS
jgi:NAD(P)-dependent dehydrogenase (short-subunit alcohol dehydrogenase family)